MDWVNETLHFGKGTAHTAEIHTLKYKGLILSIKRLINESKWYVSCIPLFHDIPIICEEVNDAKAEAVILLRQEAQNLICSVHRLGQIADAAYEKTLNRSGR